MPTPAVRIFSGSGPASVIGVGSTPGIAPVSGTPLHMAGFTAGRGGGNEVEMSGGAPRPLAVLRRQLRCPERFCGILNPRSREFALISAVSSCREKWRGQCLAEPQQIGNQIEDHRCGWVGCSTHGSYCICVKNSPVKMTRGSTLGVTNIPGDSSRQS